MTTKPRATRTFPPLPDPPEREPEDMTSFDHLTKNGGAHHLAQHLGHPGPPSSEGRGSSSGNRAPRRRTGDSPTC